MNHYELRLQVTCGSEVIEGPLSVNVQRDPDRAQCTGRFVSPGEARGGRQGRGGQAWPQHSLPGLPWAAGEVIQVPETVTPGARLYTLLPGLELRGAQVSPAGRQCVCWGAGGGRMEAAQGAQAQPLPGQAWPAEGAFCAAESLQGTRSWRWP